MADGAPQAVEDCHALLRWVIPHLDKFPRQRGFTLGDRIETALLDVLEALVTAAYSRDKRPDLDRANRRLNVLRHLWRLASELQVIPAKSYHHGSACVLSRPVSPRPGNGRNSTFMKSAKSAPATWASESDAPTPLINTTALMIPQASTRTLALFAMLLLGAPAGETVERTRPPDERRCPDGQRAYFGVCPGQAETPPAPVAPPVAEPTRPARRAPATPVVTPPPRPVPPADACEDHDSLYTCGNPYR